MLESRQQAVEAIARVFKGPAVQDRPDERSAMSYSSVEQMQIAWVQDSLQPYVSLIEDAYGGSCRGASSCGSTWMRCCAATSANAIRVVLEGLGRRVLVDQRHPPA